MPIEPVAFHAIDAETSTKLMINHFIRPLVVVPKKSKKELTTLLITSPGMCATPKEIKFDVGRITHKISNVVIRKFVEVIMIISEGQVHLFWIKLDGDWMGISLVNLRAQTIRHKLTVVIL